MTSPSSSTNPETKPRGGRLVDWIILPLSVFPIIALVTYDWRAVAALCLPPHPSMNWIGAVGDTFAYYGYLLFGLGLWLIPLLCLAGGFLRISGHRMLRGTRILWLALVLICTAALVQVLQDRAPILGSILEHLNVENAGGAVGYLLATRLAAPLIGPFGTSVLTSAILGFALLGAIGFSNIANFFKALLGWAAAGDSRDNSDDPFAGISPNGDPLGADGAPADAPADPYAAVRAAREAAKRQREAEKAAARAEKQRLREEREAAKEAARLAKAGYLPPEQPVPPATNNQQPATGNQQPATGNPQPATRNQQLATGNPQPATSNQQLATGNQQPATSNQQPATSNQQPDKPDKGPYLLPPLDLLKPLSVSTADHSDVGEMSQRLVDTLKLFGVDAKVSYTVQGPVVTKYALELAPGTRYTAVTGLSDNLMGSLRAKSLRIEAPIPGEECIGIEVPNRKPAGISFREIFESDAWRNAKAELPLLFGKRADGKELVADLASMPHMLVAGATGQGKSVCLNSLICGLLMTRTPEQLKLIMVDPKCVEFTPYSSIPHLLVPVITDNKKVVFSLHWAVAEMEKRLKLFARARVRNIYDFNHRPSVTQTDMFGDDETVNADMPRTVPYIVIIIDEAADLIGQCGKEVNPDIQRITQKARAAGIHLILATQRPDAKIITGSIKANIPGRVAFKTASSVDSRTILDDTGAENLIGKGDMLFKGKDGLLVRAQGAWISDEEIARVTSFIEQHADTQFDDRFTKKLSTIKEAEVDIFAEDGDGEGGDSAKEEAAEQREMVKAAADADLYTKAIECIINTHRASTSHFQRRLGIGYNHAAKLCDKLEDAGVIGPQKGAGPREILLDQDALVAILNGGAAAGNAASPDTDETGDESAATVDGLSPASDEVVRQET